ncbi:MAG TPA: isochorismate synthase [Saprospiraceae bacterium]|nr:isochorismate synthase [Saprospiraceae bacterium]
MEALLKPLLDAKRPFVFYKKSDSDKLFSLIQNDSKHYTTNTFLESGFIVSPFDTSHRKNLLFPLSKCNYQVYDLSGVEKIARSHTTVPISSNDEQSYSELVRETVEYIQVGKANKIVLSRVLEHPFNDLNVGALFENLIQSYPNAFVNIWYHPQVGLWLGATPERLLYLKGDEFYTMSLAGTQTFTDSITWRPKEIEEQKWVTDFIVDQLLPLVEDLTISKPKTIQSGHLAHIQTDIKAQIASAFGIKNLLRVLHPTPAVCGTPRNTARDFIVENEGYDRLYYTGYLGELNMASETNLFVNLRCLQLFDSYAKIYVGGGITKDSNPLEEWEETENKAKILRQFF